MQWPTWVVRRRRDRSGVVWKTKRFRPVEQFRTPNQYWELDWIDLIGSQVRFQAVHRSVECIIRSTSISRTLLKLLTVPQFFRTLTDLLFCCYDFFMSWLLIIFIYDFFFPQIGHEPMAPYRYKSIFGEERLILPNLIVYGNYLEFYFIHRFYYKSHGIHCFYYLYSVFGQIWFIITNTVLNSHVCYAFCYSNNVCINIKRNMTVSTP